MTRQEAILVSSGNGPGECRQAVGHLLGWLRDEAMRRDLDIDIAERSAVQGPSSAVCLISGAGAAEMARDNEGSVLWRCQSRLRPKHRRKNWFVQIFRLPASDAAIRIAPDTVHMQAIRAGGPGGQHQGKTSSAIRARWRDPTGKVWMVVVRFGNCMASFNGVSRGASSRGMALGCRNDRKDRNGRQRAARFLANAGGVKQS